MCVGGGFPVVTSNCQRYHRFESVQIWPTPALWYTRRMTLEAEVEQLRAENAELRLHAAQLQEQLAAALARIAELEQQLPDPPPFVKPNRLPATEPKPKRKKRAAHHNHGRRCEPPTRTQTHALDRCPACHYQLRGQSIDYRRQVIELPPPMPVEIVEHQVIKRFCPHCRRWRSPQLDLTGQVFGQGRIGVRIASLVAFLALSLRLPMRRIQAYLRLVHQLTISSGEVVELLHAVRYYEYDHSRGQAVVKRILGGTFNGHLVSDFYCGYNGYAGKHQRCWVHLLRDLHALKESQAEDAVVVTWAQDVRALYDDAQTWLQEQAGPSQEERELQYVGLVARAHALGLQYARVKAHACQALAKRLLRHEDELFQFVLIAGLSADNNLAERSIRPLVVIRKISGGSRSAEGTKTRMALASLFETWQARGLNPLEECRRLLGQTTVS